MKRGKGNKRTCWEWMVKHDENKNYVTAFQQHNTSEKKIPWIIKLKSLIFHKYAIRFCLFRTHSISVMYLYIIIFVCIMCSWMAFQSHSHLSFFTLSHSEIWSEALNGSGNWCLKTHFIPSVMPSLLFILFLYWKKLIFIFMMLFCKQVFIKC